MQRIRFHSLQQQQRQQTLLQMLLLLMVAMATQVNASGFWNSQYATKDFSRARYQCQYPIIIFQHVTNNQSFYSAPLVQLDHQSGNVIYNSLTGFYELRFHVLMWNHYIREFVLNHLKNDKSVRNPEVKLLPMEKSRFTWSSSIRINGDTKLDEAYKTMSPTPDTLSLKFSSSNRTHLQQLNSAVKENPDLLDSIELQSFIVSEKTATKSMIVTVDHLQKSKMFSKLKTIPPDSNYNYMKSDDFNTLIQETYSSVRASTIREGEFMDKSDELNIVNLIENALKQDEVIASALTATQWDSVFWNPLFTRPDKVTHIMNKTFTRDASDGSFSVNREFLNSNDDARDLLTSQNTDSANDYSGQAEVGFWWLAGGAASAPSQSRNSHGSESRNKPLQQSLQTGRISDQQLKQMLSERQLEVEWTGEKFTPRPLRLVRVNRRSFESRRHIVSQSLQLSLYQQTLALKVQIARNQSADGCVQDNEEPEDSGGDDVRGSTSSSYCLLSNSGSCPPGFASSRGHAIGFRIGDSTAEAFVKPAVMGDSRLRCHSPHSSNDCSNPAFDPFKVELYLSACCR